MVDFHSHILPCMDHGSKSLEESLAQLDLACEYGVDKIIATSHFYPHMHSVEGYLKKRDESYALLRENMRPEHPEIKLGAEVLLCQGMEKLDNLEKLCIDGADYILLEIPFNDYDSSLVESVWKIQSKGIARVILAHAERYNPKIIEDFIEIGAKIQLNAHCLTKLFLKSHIASWLKRGLVVALGSDIHGVNDVAYKRFVKAIEKLGPYREAIASESDRIWYAAISPLTSNEE